MIPVFHRVSTCHEVAINEYFGLDLETHQNSLGFEKQYTEHPKAKSVSRDKRVRIIWELIMSELKEDPELEGIEPLFPVIQSRPNLYCPVCGEPQFKWIRVSYGYHMDGTRNWGYRPVLEGCEHLIGGTDDFDEHDFRVIGPDFWGGRESNYFSSEGDIIPMSLFDFDSIDIVLFDAIKDWEAYYVFWKEDDELFQRDVEKTKQFLQKLFLENKEWLDEKEQEEVEEKINDFSPDFFEELISDLSSIYYMLE